MKSGDWGLQLSRKRKKEIAVKWGQVVVFYVRHITYPTIN